jgi:hypothetical protein
MTLNPFRINYLFVTYSGKIYSVLGAIPQRSVVFPYGVYNLDSFVSQLTSPISQMSVYNKLFDRRICASAFKVEPFHLPQ